MVILIRQTIYVDFSVCCKDTRSFFAKEAIDSTHSKYKVQQTHGEKKLERDLMN